MEKDATEQQPQKAMVDLNKWRQLVASKYGPKSPTTRLLLLTLSLHMDKSGGSCWPATKTIATETGLSERVVCKHIALAVENKWLQKSIAGKSGQRWKRNQYLANTPKALTLSQHLNPQGTDPKSAPCEKGTDFECKKALTLGQSSYSYELSNNELPTFLLKDGTDHKVERDFFELLKETYPGVNIEAELQKIKAWCVANPTKRKTRRGAKQFVNGWMGRVKTDRQASSQEHISYLKEEIDLENQFKCDRQAASGA